MKMADTKIEWAQKTWNPVTGCTPISEGCANCYAERMAHRLQAMGQARYKDGFKVTYHEEALDEPDRWKKPSRIFVCSMADLFHEDVPHDFIAEVMSVISLNRQHTFLILTKRPEIMKRHFEQLYFIRFPLPNLWLGVTTENQEQADKRIPILMQIPAAKRFVSIEPMLSAVDLTEIKVPKEQDMLNHSGFYPSKFNSLTTEYDDVHYYQPPAAIDWVICGGESGPGARPMHPEWVRNLRDQCQAAVVPFLFKQWGEWQDGSEYQRSVYNGIVLNNGAVVHPGDPTPGVTAEEWNRAKPTMMAKVGKKKAGRLLDGKLWDEYPEAKL